MSKKWSLNKVEEKLEKVKDLVEEIAEDYPAIENEMDRAYYSIVAARDIVRNAKAYGEAA